MPITLASAIQTLKLLAPLENAEPWDNVGVLVEPAAREGQPSEVARALLTIDLTDDVLEEAVAAECELIIAYHPPIFKGIKRLVTGDPVSRRIIDLVERGIAVYSPHTALDATAAGVNDWLIGAFGPGLVEPVTQARSSSQLKVVVFVPEEDSDRLRLALSEAGAGDIGEYSQCSFNLGGVGTFLGSDRANPAVGRAGQFEKVQEMRMEMLCPSNCLNAVAAAIATHHPYEEPVWDVYPLEAKPLAGVGLGRRLALRNGISISDAIERVKKHLGLEYVRVATSLRHGKGELISQIAACAGAGGSVLSGLSGVDLILSGELRHHDVLSWVHSGTSVIVCDHTNTERGFLPIFAQQLRRHWGTDVEVLVSIRDADPLCVV